MDKAASIKVARILADAETTIVSVTQERDALAVKCAHYEQREQATKVASLMHDKGIKADVEFADLVDQLAKEAAAGRLPEIARAAEMVGPNMSFGTAHDGQAVQGGDVLTNYLVGFVG